MMIAHQHIHKDSFAFCLSTAAAYHFDLAGLIVQHVQAQNISYHDYDAIKIVLQEVIANAVIHGNLDIQAMERRTLDGLNKMQALLEARLSDPSYAQRWLKIHFTLKGDTLLFSVQDQGQWRNTDGMTQGRGFFLIQHHTASYAIDKETSTTSVCFKNHLLA